MKFAVDTRVSATVLSRAEGGGDGPSEWTVLGPGPLRNGKRLYRLAPADDRARYALDVLRSGQVNVRGRLNEDGEFIATAQFLLVVDSTSGNRA